MPWTGRSVGGRIGQQLLLQLLLAVLLAGVPEVAGRVVAGPELEFIARPFQRDLDAAVPAVGGQIRAAVPEQVVRRRVLHDLRVDLVELVAVEERPASRVLRERRERVLRGRQAVAGALHRLPRERALAAHAALAGLTTGGQGLQAPRVGRVDRHVGADRAVHHRAHGGLVVHALLRHPAAEVEDGLLLFDAGEDVGERPQRVEAAVRIEDAELRIVRRERVARVDGALGVDRLRLGRPGPFRRAQLIQRRQQEGAIGGEVLVDRQRCPQRDDADQIGSRQPLRHVVTAGCHRARHFLRLHRAQVEEEHHQAAIAQVGDGTGGKRGRRRVAGNRARARFGGRRQRPGHAGQHLLGNLGRRRHGVEFLEVEARHRLRLVVLLHREVVLRQAADELAVPVAHDHVHDHEVAARAEDGPALGREPLRLLGRQREGTEQDGGNRREQSARAGSVRHPRAPSGR